MTRYCAEYTRDWFSRDSTTVSQESGTRDYVLKIRNSSRFVDRVQPRVTSMVCALSLGFAPKLSSSSKECHFSASVPVTGQNLRAGSCLLLISRAWAFKKARDAPSSSLFASFTKIDPSERGYIFRQITGFAFGGGSSLARKLSIIQLV
jgi:hypothetical protein